MEAAQAAGIAAAIHMRLDQIFTVTNKYISYNLHPLTKFTSYSKIQNKGPYTKASLAK